MTSTSSVFPVSFTALTLGFLISTAAAAQPGPRQCVFDAYAPTAVYPYYVEDPAAFVSGSGNSLRGAAMFIPAREGLTREWLELSVRRAFESGRDDKCLPRMPVEIAVGSAGTGFWVYLGAERSAEGLLRWAQDKVQRQPRPEARLK